MSLWFPSTGLLLRTRREEVPFLFLLRDLPNGLICRLLSHPTTPHLWKITTRSSTAGKMQSRASLRTCCSAE
ncbi:hypothetical protein DPMN_000384 [Dreissena polymorpha]|uniref:Uncharacterized protein n=1 Tax=Dreissena polymorpha TaxID=45954 RepID=A0A9D4RPV9_DREPO|nr:hypothetical protein DPMN_000384 [Dreissena polymorpha]